MKVLITGTRSGFGKHLADCVPCVRLERNTPWDVILHAQPYDVIIHCAADSTPKINSSSIVPFFESNFDLTEALLQLRPKRFIYLSSIDVYPRNQKMYSEGESIELENPCSLYAASKLFGEALIRTHAPNHLILRLSMLLGKYMRPNSISKMISGKPYTLTLSSESTFNCVLYEDLARAIMSQLDVDEGYKGTVNACSSESVRLANIAHAHEINFGKFVYTTPRLSTAKTHALFPWMDKTTRQVIEEFQSRGISVKSA